MGRGEVKYKLSLDNAEFQSKAAQSEKTFGSVTKQIQGYIDHLSGAKATDQVRLLEQAVQKMGGTSKLSAHGVHMLSSELQRLEAAGARIPSSLQGAVGSVNSLGSAAKSAGVQQLQGLTTSLGPLGGVLTSIGPAGLAAAAGLGAAALAGKGLADAATGAVTYAGRLQDLSAKTDLGVVSLQRLEFAGDLVGVKLESISDSVFKLQAAMENAPEKFRSLGLSIEHLKSLSPEAMLAEVARAIAGIAEPSVRNAVAMDLMQKKASELMPFLRSGFKDAGDEAQRLGIVMDASTVASLDRVGDAATKLSRTWDGLWNNIGSAIAKAPPVAAAIDAITSALGKLSSAVQGGGLTGGVNEVAGWMMSTPTGLAATAATAPVSVPFLAAAGLNEAYNVGSDIVGGMGREETPFNMAEYQRGRMERQQGQQAATGPGRTIETPAQRREREAKEKEAERERARNRREAARQEEAEQKRYNAAVDAYNEKTYGLKGGVGPLPEDPKPRTELDRILEAANERHRSQYEAMFDDSIEGAAGRRASGVGVNTDMWGDLPMTTEQLGEAMDFLNDSARRASRALGEKLIGGLEIAGTVLDALGPLGDKIGSVLGDTGAAANLGRAAMSGDIAGGLMAGAQLSEGGGVLGTYASIFTGGGLLNTIGGLFGGDSKKAAGQTGFASTDKLIDMLTEGRAKTEEIASAFDEAFNEIMPDAIDSTTGMLSANAEELIRLAQNAGIASKAIQSLMRAQSEALAGNLAGGLASVKTSREAGGKGLASQGAATAVASSIYGSYQQMLEQGATRAEAFERIGPAVTAMREELNAAGFEGGALFGALEHQISIVTGEITGPLVAGVGSFSMALANMSNLGMLNQETFAGLTEQIGVNITALAAQGVTGPAAVAALQPELQRVWELQQKYGFAVDQTTQKLIDEGVAGGSIGAQFSSATDQMVASSERVATAVEAIAVALGAIPNEAALAAGALAKLGSVSLPGAGGGSAGPGPVASEPNEPLPENAVGGLFKYRQGGTVGIFGEEENEYAVPASKAQSFARAILGDSGGNAGPGGSSISITFAPGAFVIQTQSTDARGIMREGAALLEQGLLTAIETAVLNRLQGRF